MNNEKPIINNVQKCMEQKYPKFIQQNLKKLDISFLGLKGELDLRNFSKLEELNCSHNLITELDLSSCRNLKKLEAHGNKGLQIIWKREGGEMLIQNYGWKKEWNQHQQSQTQPKLKNEVKKQRRQAQIIPRHEIIWTDLDLDFTFELTQAWQEMGFSKEQSQEWINVGFKPTDYEICAWLRDVEKVDAERVLNGAISRERVEQSFYNWKQAQLENQIEGLLHSKY